MEPEDLTIPVDELGNTEDALALPPEQAPEAGLDSFLDTTVVPVDQAEIENLQDTTAQNEADLVSAMFNTESQGARTLQAEQDAGIPQLSTELTEITNELNQTSLAFRRTRERIQDQTGLTAAQKNARLNDVSREQSATLADLEVIRQARSNTLTNAQNIIARKTELQFADEQSRINNLKFIYDNNKDKLNKVEDRQFQQLLTREDRAFQLAKDEFQTVEQIKLQLVGNAGSQSAPNGVLKAIMASDNIADAYKAAGQYGISIADKVARDARNASINALNLSGGDEFAAIEASEKVEAISSLIDNENLDAVIGGTKAAVKFGGSGKELSAGVSARVTRAQRADLIASIENQISGLTLDELANAKARGVTFGALSEQEMKTVAAAANRIGQRRITDKNGNILGYRGTEASVRKDLALIQDAAKRDYKRRTGQNYQTLSFDSETSYVDTLFNASPFGVLDVDNQ